MKLSLSTLVFAIAPLAVVQATGIEFKRSVRPVHRRQSTPIVGNLTNADAPAAYAAQCNMINSAEGTAAIQADIHNVTINSLAVQTAFQAIGAQLSFIDSENLSSQKFSSDWTALIQQWTNILWDSRATAANTVAYTTEFTTVIMPFVANLSGPIPPATSIEVLQEYIGEAQMLQKAAQATAEDFTLLQGNLTTFAATFQGFATQEKSTDNGSITELMNDIAQLNSQIDTLNTEIAIVGGVIGATIFIDVSVLGLFPEFAPIIIGAGVAAVGGETAGFAFLEGELSSDYKQVASDMAQIVALQDNLQAIAQADSKLASIKNQTATMTTQLGAFNSIWGAVVDDATQVIFFLNSAENQVVIPMIFWATINQVNCYYQAMGTAMNDYADGISSSGIPPSTQSSVQLLDQGVLHTTAMNIVSQGLAKARAMA